MSKKRATASQNVARKTALSPAGKDSPKAPPRSAPKPARPANTISNFARQRAAQEAAAARVTWVDRIALWLGRRSRLTRTLICAMIAIVFAAGTGLLIYSSLYNIDPRRISFGPINAQTLPLFVLIALVVAGFAFYWAGWRVMIGFDFEDAPLQPGRAAALWLIFGVFMFAFVLLFAAIQYGFAIQP